MRSLPKLLVLLAVLLSVSLGACKKPEPAPAKLTRGAELYGRMCAVCHGEKGEGYKADQAPRLAQPEFQTSVSDEQLREAIKNGRAGTTMSAWSKDRGGPPEPRRHRASDRVSAHLAQGRARGLGRATARRGFWRAARACSRANARAATGRAAWAGRTCTSAIPNCCRPRAMASLRYAIKNGRPGTLMPSFAETVGDAGIEDLTGLLRSWANPAPPPPAPVPPPPIPLGPVPLNPHGPDAIGFKAQPETTPMEIVHAQLQRGARMALLDARAPSDYMNQHIAGAVSVPFYDPTPYLTKLPKNSWLRLLLRLSARGVWDARGQAGGRRVQESDRAR